MSVEFFSLPRVFDLFNRINRIYCKSRDVCEEKVAACLKGPCDTFERAP